MKNEFTLLSDVEQQITSYLEDYHMKVFMFGLTGENEPDKAQVYKELGEFGEENISAYCSKHKYPHILNMLPKHVNLARFMMTDATKSAEFSKPFFDAVRSGDRLTIEGEKLSLEKKLVSIMGEDNWSNVDGFVKEVEDIAINYNTQNIIPSTDANNEGGNQYDQLFE